MEPCEPLSQVVDVAMVIDTSISMGDTTGSGSLRKIDAAVQAGKALVELLLPPDRASKVQVTVVGFNSTPTLAQSLTGDREALLRALDNLPATQADGTYPWTGLHEAMGQLEASSRPDAKQALIIVSDGEPHPDDVNNALAEAQRIRDAGVEIFGIGLGLEPDAQAARDFLIAISSPDRFSDAPEAEDLEVIYREIGAFIPCPE